MQAIVPVGAERLPLAEAGGRFLAEAPRAERSAPPFRCSAMDGYAVRHADVASPVELQVREVVYAGDDPGGAIGPGQATRIFTGAPLPPGADAVVREESTEARGDRVLVRHPVRKGENVRPEGEDVARGGEVLPAGARIGPRQLALLAAVGCEWIPVRRRVRVAVLSTGDEVVKGRTPDSNGVALEGLLAGCGLAVRRSAAGDDPDALRAAVEAALEGADALVTVGGVSIGERDRVAGTLSALGAEIRVHGVPMKPGKPFLFATVDGKPVLGLPGSPSACLVAFEVFARPALLRLAGATATERPRVFLPLAAASQGRPGRARFLWASLTPDGRALPVGRDAAQILGPALAQALVRIPEGTGDLPEGERVETWLLGG